jgi:nucleoside triphosphate pyrophosphatase
MPLPPLILASASPRRSELLRRLGREFTVIPGQAPEVQPEHLTPQETSQINAYRKARMVAKRFPDALVLGADTIVCLDTVIFGKPADRGAAERMLATLQGRTHQVITGGCLVHLRSHRQRLFAVTTRVTFRALTGDQIRDYLAAINPLDKAGAYAIQEQGDRIVAAVDGSTSNVIGLPLEQLEAEFDAWGR